MEDDTAHKASVLGILTSVLLLSSLAIFAFSIPAAAQSNSGVYFIDMNLLPARVELGSGSTGYIGLFSSAEAHPATAPRDLEIELSSSNSTIASVPTQVIIPAGEQYAVFDIAPGNIEGETEISALYGNQIVSKNFVISDARSQIPSDVKLVINLPSKKMQIGAEMPVSIYLEDEGAAVQAPQDITISLDYQRELISLSSSRVTIEKGNYYALVNVRTLEKSGFAFIKASTVEEPFLNTVAVVEIAMTQPTSLKTYVFPDMIGPSERTIDIFVALLDAAGNPTIAPEDIELHLFANSPGVQGISNVDAKIRKGEYGYYLRQSVSFIPRDAAIGVEGSGIVDVVIGASSPGLGASSASFSVMPEDLHPDNVKADEKTVRIFTIDIMPSDANAIVVYQIAAIAQDSRDADYDDDGDIDVDDNTAAAEDDIPVSDRDMDKDGVVDGNDFHAIDNLADGELYPIRSNVLYSTGQGNLDVVTGNIEALRITDSGSIGSGSSYGAAIVSSERLGTNLGVSASIGGVGAATGSITVVGGLNPVKTSIVSPLRAAQDGSSRISFNGDGYSDLFIIALDSENRPARSSDGISYLIEPINEVVNIEPGESYTIARIYASWFGASSQSVISVTPIGVNADASLRAESQFYLVPSAGTAAKVTFPFEGIIGSSTSHAIGIVQLADSTGNQVLASDNLTVRLVSSDPGVLQVPSEVVIPQGKSFVSFSVTTFGKSGTVSVSASAEGVGSSTTEISSVLAELEGSFVERSGLIANIPQTITISTTLEGTSVLWGAPAAFEILSKDDMAQYDPDTDSYIANMEVIANREGNFTISATLLKDGFQPTKISRGTVFEPYLTEMIVSIDYQQTTITYNQPTTINVLIVDQADKPIEGALIEVSSGSGATIVPESIRTDADGKAAFVYTFSGTTPKVSLNLIASKDGYVDGQVSEEFEVVGIPTALPPWALYAAIAGVVASIGVGVVYFMKKPKGKRLDEEVEEEDEEI